MPKKCRDCAQDMVSEARLCPHCGRPSLFPNVEEMGTASRSAALAARYEEKLQKARDEGREKGLQEFELALKSAVACKALPAREITRLVGSDTAVGATYYQQIDGRSRLPDENEWDRLRRVADAIFFGSYASDIHFAALSLNSRWPTNYGEGAIFFRDEMISHRTTLFEENIVIWHKQNPGIRDVPAGSSAVWDERHLLGIAKLGDKVDGETPTDELLLNNGVTSGSDSFIEVHICGTFTARSATTFVVKRPALSALDRQVLTDKAAAIGYKFTEIS